LHPINPKAMFSNRIIALALKSILVIGIGISSIFNGFAQETQWSASLENQLLVGSGSDLPFWFTHNQLGRYKTNGAIQDITEATFVGKTILPSDLLLNYGTTFGVLSAKNSFDPILTEAYVGLSWKGFTLEGGAFAEKEFLGGLSTSNGDIVRSLDSKPYPKLRFGTNGYIPFFFGKKWFKYAAEYDEGLTSLDDQAVVKSAHIHHKSLGVQIAASKSFKVSAALNHYVFWGGSSSQTTMPEDFHSYLLYITGSSGGSNFPGSDQINRAGNQLGSYLIKLEKELNALTVQLWVSHPFEDISGMQLVNWRDNQWSLDFKKKSSGTWLDQCLLEYVYSKHQSGGQTAPEPGYLRAKDNYFNNGVYQTGFSYMGYSMGTPLFGPIITGSDGLIYGFSNTRIRAFHLAGKGFITPQLRWKTMFTWTENFGTYHSTLTPSIKKFYSYAEVNWHCPKQPFVISGKIEEDFNSLGNPLFGAAVGLKWLIQ
jgi:hypothetical protein